MAKVTLRERVQKYVEACPKSRIFSLGHAYEAGWRARGRADRLTKAERELVRVTSEWVNGRVESKFVVRAVANLERAKGRK